MKNLGKFEHDNDVSIRSEVIRSVKEGLLIYLGDSILKENLINSPQGYKETIFEADRKIWGTIVQDGVEWLAPKVDTKMLRLSLVPLEPNTDYEFGFVTHGGGIIKGMCQYSSGKTFANVENIKTGMFSYRFNSGSAKDTVPHIYIQGKIKFKSFYLIKVSEA